MMCPVTNDVCRTNGCGYKCHNRDSLGQKPVITNVRGTTSYTRRFYDCAKCNGLNSIILLEKESDEDFSVEVKKCLKCGHQMYIKELTSKDE